MKDKYIDLIEQSFDFPQDEFSVEDSELLFHDIPLMEPDKTVRDTAENHLSAENFATDQPRQAHVQRGDGQGRLQGFVQLLLLHQVEPFLVRAGGGDEERHPPRNLVGIRHPHHQRPLRRRHHRQGPLHHLQRIQASAVCGEHRPVGERRIHQHDSRPGQQGGTGPVRGRLHQEVQGRHPHRLRGGTQIRVLHFAAGNPLQRHRGVLQGQAQEQQEVPAQDAALLHQYGHQGHGLLLERACRSA